MDKVIGDMQDIRKHFKIRHRSTRKERFCWEI